MRVATKGDLSDHGNGSINAFGAVTSVKANGRDVAVNLGNGAGSNSDSACDSDDHCAAPAGKSGASQGATNVFVEGLPVHREGDSRGCGGKTVVGSSRTVNVN